MGDETIERPALPKEGSDKAVTQRNKCGLVVLYPNPLELQKGTIVHEDGATKETWTRYSVDEFIAFSPDRKSSVPELLLHAVRQAHRDQDRHAEGGSPVHPRLATRHQGLEARPEIHRSRGIVLRQEFSSPRMTSTRR